MDIVEGLLAAYRTGVFPMAESKRSDARIFWFRPDPRAILPLTEAEGLHVPRTAARAARRGGFEIRIDTAFRDVVKGCAGPRRRRRGEPGGSWINPTIIEWYSALHEAGHAHSVEAWKTDPASGEERLVGGVYGVAIGAAFFAESMFHRARARMVPDGKRHPLDGTNASSVCLIRLVRLLAENGYELCDVQYTNPHIARFGVREIPLAEYLSRLERAVRRPDRWPARV